MLAPWMCFPYQPPVRKMRQKRGAGEYIRIFAEPVPPNAKLAEAEGEAKGRSVNAIVGTSVEFVCNLPGPVEEVVALVREMGTVTSGVYPRLFATVEATGWTQVGDNYVGPPLGNHVASDVGVYVRVPKTSLHSTDCRSW